MGLASTQSRRKHLSESTEPTACSALGITHPASTDSSRDLGRDLVEEGLDRLEKALDIRQLVDLLSQTAAARQSVGVPTGELAQLVEGELGRLALGHQPEMTEDQLPAVLESRFELGDPSLRFGAS